MGRRVELTVLAANSKSTPPPYVLFSFSTCTTISLPSIIALPTMKPLEAKVNNICNDEAVTDSDPSIRMIRPCEG